MAPRVRRARQIAAPQRRFPLASCPSNEGPSGEVADVEGAVPAIDLDRLTLSITKALGSFSANLDSENCFFLLIRIRY